MNVLAQTAYLLGQEIRSDRRDPRRLAALLLYALCAVVLLYSAMDRFTVRSWNALFWVVMLFAAVSVAGRSFERESGRRHLYWYSLVSPESLLMAKVTYSSLLIFGLGLVVWLLLSLFSGLSAIGRPGLFVATLGLGSLGLGATFGFLGAIGMRAGGGGTMLTLLAFPLLMPLLLLLVRAGQFALDAGAAGADAAFLQRLALEGGLSRVLSLLVGIDLIMLSVGMVLFPFAWRD